jgi:hypothetical protein
MAKDVLITPASGKIEFDNSAGSVVATIEFQDDNSLNISNTAGGISIGNTSSDIYVGDGSNPTDIIFEQDGEIRGLTGKTVTLGQSDSIINFNAEKVGFLGGTSQISVRTLEDGTLSFEGGNGQLFSVSDNLSGTIFSVNDISGIPSIEVLDDGTVKLAEYGGTVTVNGQSISNTYAPKNFTINTKTGNYTLVLGDALELIQMNVGSANTLTVPTNASVAFPVGTSIRDKPPSLEQAE